MNFSQFWEWSNDSVDCKSATSFRNLPHPADLRVRQIAKADYRLGDPGSQRGHGDEASSDGRHVNVDFHNAEIFQTFKLLGISVL